MSATAYDFDSRGYLVPGSDPATAHSRFPAAARGQIPAEQLPKAPLPYPLAPRPKPADLRLERTRDDLLTDFGKATLTDRYLMPGESFQDMFARRGVRLCR